MKSIELDLPKWSPKWLADKKDGQPNNVPSAALHGLLFPLLIFLHFVKTLGIGKVAGFGTILSLIWSAILSTDQRSVVRTLLTLSIVAAAGFWVWSHQSSSPTKRRLLLSVVTAIMSLWVAWLIVWLWLASLIFVVGRAVLDSIFNRVDTELEKQRQGLPSKSSVIRPWAICWCIVKNVNDGEDTWAKVRPCILLPPPPWADGRLAYDPVDYYKGPDDGYYDVLICTSQPKRESDGRYLEIYPFARLKHEDRLARTFVYLGERYSMSSDTSEYGVQVQTEMLADGRIPSHHVVFQKHIALLSERDIHAIVDHFPKMDFEAERQQRLRNWKQGNK
jgi:uncharacterized RDD family membrane protein YckC